MTAVGILGKDIRVKDFDIQFSTSQDFSIVSDDYNLYQAIVDRLQTIKGEYYITEYGSELSNCLGKPRNELLKSQIIGYVSECLNQEPRIQKVEAITITYPSDNEKLVNIEITIIPIDSTIAMNLIYPLFLS